MQFEGVAADDVDRHLRLLLDGGMLTGKADMDGIVTSGLSWAGCEFLDSIREPAIWRKTKSAAQKAGSVSLL